MAAEVQEGLRLDRTESGLLVVSVADGGECLITPDLIKRSKVLSTLHAACANGESARLDADLTAIQSWLDLASCDIQGTAIEARHDIRSQLQMIQAADLLDDPEALSQACALVAALAFPLLCFSKDDPTAEVQQQQAATAAEVVEALPEHLVILTLRAAFAAVPPRITGGGWQSTLPSRARHLTAWLPLLPAPLQPLLLRALDPSIDAHRRFSLDLPVLEDAAPTTEAIARGLGTHLTALSLRNCDFPFHILRDGTPVTGSSDVGREQIRRTIAPVATMTALECLNLEVWPAQMSRAWADHFFACAAEALPALPQLTRLCMRAEGSGANGAAAAALAQVTTLRMLRALDLKGFGLAGQGVAVQRLAAALPALTGLSHLSLSTNPLTSDGWAVLAPVLAPMKLRCLNLYNCLLDYTMRFLPGPLDPDDPPFSELETLNISRNQWSVGVTAAVAGLPKLARLTLAEGWMPAEQEQPLFDALASDAAPRLRELRFGVVARRPLAVAALCACLRRWEGLEVLAVHGQGVATDLLDVLPYLGALAKLRDLDLQCFWADPEDAVDPLGGLKGLTRLRLGYVVCPDGVVAAFERGIGALTVLQALEVAFVAVAFRAATGAAFARAVAPLTRLTRLSLRCCCLGRVGTHQLAQALTCMPGMRELELEQNRVKAKAMGALTPALAALDVLSVLCLASNPIGDSGAMALAEVLPRMQAMRTLDVRECSIGDAGRQALSRAVPRGMHEVLFVDQSKDTVY